VWGTGRIRLGFMNIYRLLVGCRATSGWPKIRVGLVPGHRAEGATQARSDHRAGPARGTIPFVPCRARAGFFRAVPVPAHRAWPIWPSISTTKEESKTKRRIMSRGDDGWSTGEATHPGTPSVLKYKAFNGSKFVPKYKAS
jgi:hypothetical protein